jgi:hypothetical protein
VNREPFGNKFFIYPEQVGQMAPKTVAGLNSKTNLFAKNSCRKSGRAPVAMANFH